MQENALGISEYLMRADPPPFYVPFSLNDGVAVLEGSPAVRTVPRHLPYAGIALHGLHPQRAPEAGSFA